MNNLHPISIQGETKASLHLAVHLSFELDANLNDYNGPRELTQSMSYKATSDTVVFYSTIVPGAIALLTPLNWEEVADIIHKWLQSTATYPKPPFFDGDAHHGWLLTNSKFSDHDEHWSRILQVQATNILYGK